MENALKFEEKQLIEDASQWEHSETEKGQVYTRPEVVDFMLTTIGLNDDKDLKTAKILEPSCGEGEFILAIAERLIKHPENNPSVDQLMGRVLAVDLVDASIDIAKNKVRELLLNNDYSEDDSQKLLNDWFLTADFLLTDIPADFTHVIGNPPYVRVENIPKRLLEAYRKRFSTMTDRADLYIPFFEKSLALLTNGGKLSFICTDRWTKNTYGKSLRQFISKDFSLELFIDLYGIDAFEQKVMTYPAITQIAKKRSNQTVFLRKTEFTPKEAKAIVQAVNGKASNLQIQKDVVSDSKPWLLGATKETALIQKLENQYPLLEETGCKVFIGAATGANKVYLVDKDKVDIEESRLLPTITANELKRGSIQWNGKYLVNTYGESGVINLGDYPRLANYLSEHKPLLSKRHVAKKDSTRWFKTIDRVYKERSKMKKLLIPDISSDPIVIYDEGVYHPNNSIYYICSDNWDLHALRVVLLSKVTKLFIAAYSTKIAKGYLRFQAQHLRKLRIPNWESIDTKLKTEMIKAGKSNDTASFTPLTCEMYNLSKKETDIVEH